MAIEKFEDIITSDIKKLIVNNNISIIKPRKHSKASEVYVDVIFKYDSEKWSGSVPIEYRRTNTHAKTVDDIVKIINNAYEEMKPEKREQWISDQDSFWKESNKEVTRPFFEVLKDSQWKCQTCELPMNPNWARRVQDIKELGYTLATDTSLFCKNCKKKTTHLILLRLPRGNETGYETINPALKKKILKVLKNYDVYENRYDRHLLPDHKFSEIRWDEKCRSENPKNMSEAEIKRKFQLMTNQRNEQKREVCRECYQTNKRGTPYGIKFFYEGTEEWPISIPKKGKDAEQGCVGCGWYDLETWRKNINSKLN